MKAIQDHLQSLIKSSNQTKDVEIQAMSRDNCKDHSYFMFLTTHSQVNTLRVYLDEWLSKAFLKTHIQANILFLI